MCMEDRSIPKYLLERVAAIMVVDLNRRVESDVQADPTNKVDRERRERENSK